MFYVTLPDAARLDLLAYCVALTLKPKLAPATGEKATAYDSALALTKGNVSGYWRPTKDNCLARLTREQLLAIGRDVLGDVWAHSSRSEKKALLVDQLDRAFSDPEKSGPTPDHVERLKTWLPTGMAFAIIPATKPANGKKTRKAA